MDAMHSAVKAKRFSQQKPGLMERESEPAEPMEQPEQETQGSGMSELVAKLSPEQKQELMTLLGGEQSENHSSSSVERGAPTSEEKARIDEKMKQPQEGDDSIDSVMVDSRDMNAPERKPRGLGDRARLDAAKRLKAKGRA